ncbi:hypothetical protein Pd630_LPD00937 [Rhodococcus opacus PD630]|nr:hypothetical protein Pd630_LPD00937 [Rhodococcus opacus PD630]
MPYCDQRVRGPRPSLDRTRCSPLFLGGGDCHNGYPPLLNDTFV